MQASALHALNMVSLPAPLTLETLGQAGRDRCDGVSSCEIARTTVANLRHRPVALQVSDTIDAEIGAIHTTHLSQLVDTEGWDDGEDVIEPTLGITGVEGVL